MSLISRGPLSVWFVLLLTVAAATAVVRGQNPQTSVLTQHNDNARSGTNLNETVLTTSNVNVNQFGKLFTRQVDGQIYAQPLYVPSVDFGHKGIHNAVYVATEKNNVYAFDADDPAAADPLWMANFGPPFPYEEAGGPDINEAIGITSTPAIDPVSRTLFLVAKTKEGSNYFHRLHALDLATGLEKLGGPVLISGSVPGGGVGGVGGTVPFDALRQLNRPALLLYNGYVYIAFGSHNDIPPWHGWVFGYNAATLQQTSVFNTTPQDYGGGIWQSGQGLSVDDSGSLYFMTGNGSFSANTGGPDLGTSFIRLSTPTLQVQDWFTPNNVDTLNSLDEDLGSAGPLLLPGTNLIVGGGKEGVLYLLDRSNMGHFRSGNNSQIVQSFQGSAGHIHGSPVSWNSPQGGQLLYIWGENDVLNAYHFNGATFDRTPASRGTVSAPEGMPGAMLSVSASGNIPGSGIVWASMPATGDANLYTTPGVLRAYDASNVAVELWNSLQNQPRDDVGEFAKYCPPTIVNGKVYLATFSNQLVVYGLNPPPSPPPPTPGSGINFVQVASATPSNVANVTVAYPAAQTAGNLNVVAVGWNNSTSSVTSVTDSRGNSYALAIGPTRTTTFSHAIYYAKNIVAGSNSVTVRFDAAPASPDVRVLEYSGLDRTDPLDRTAGATGNSSVPNSGPITTRFGPELIFAGNSVEGQTVAAGQYFASRRITSPYGNIAEDLIVADAGTYAATAHQTSTGGLWVMQTATFKGANAVAATAPTVTAVTPTSGSTGGGTLITITGTNFVAGAAVTLGGLDASTVTVVNSTTITAVTPAHATGTVPLTVTNADTQSGTLSSAFTYVSPTAPTIGTLSPGSGSTIGGTAVAITGSNFAVGATVAFGGTASPSVTVNDGTSIVAVTPAHAAGPVTVTVTNPNGESATRASGFTYALTAPTLTFVSPNSGLTAGGASVTITGTNFTAGATVGFGGVAATNVVVANATSITAVTPAHTAGTVNVTVTNTDGQIGTLTNGFVYGAPSQAISFVQLASATPQSASVASVAVTLPAAATAGDLNVVAVGWNNTTSTVQSISDNAGNLYLLAIGPTTGTGLRQSLYYASNINGGTTTVTVTFSPAAAYPDVRLLEYRGVSVLDVTAAATGNSTASNSGTVTTTSPNELIFGANMVATLTSAAGSGFTKRIITTPDGDIAEDRIVTSAGNYTATATLSSAGPWIMQMATFKPVTSPAPTVVSVLPATGSTLGGTPITITGSNFIGGATVSIGGTAATAVTVVGQGSITATTAAHAVGAANVTVTNPDAQSATLSGGFTYVSTAPTISSVAPTSGTTLGGTSVIITGTKFVTGATVTIGGVPATNVVVVDATSIAATTPAHAAGAVNVTVTNPDAQSAALANGFTYVSTAPTISSVAPASGTTAGGTNVTITGTKFVSGATVTIGGAPASNIVVVDATSITATTPSHTAGAVDVTVTNPDAQAATLTGGFNYRLPAPTLSAVTPGSGTTLGGTAVTLTGSNFTTGATVNFGGTAATNVIVADSGSITALTPAHAAGAVNVTVTDPDGQSHTLNSGFTYVSTAPTITSVSPNSGPAEGGNAVIVTGTNFVAGTTITFGGTTATNVAFVGPTTITATTPAHAGGVVAVTASNPDGQNGSLSNAFTYLIPAPGITGVTPVSGSTIGGTSVTIRGTNLAAGASVKFGGVAATSVAVVDANSITAVAPPHAAAVVDVVVINPDAQSSTLANAFTYVFTGPTISDVSPTSGTTLGGTVLSIVGTNFSVGATISIGGSPATNVVVNGSFSITATTPAHAAGPVSVVVTNPDSQTATLSGGFTYISTAPTVIGVSPAIGTTLGGTSVSIAGTNFAPGASVTIGGSAAANVVVTSATSLSATTPAHAAGAVSVTVTNPDTQSGTRASAFTYVSTAPTVTTVTPATGPTTGGTSVTIAGTNFVTGAIVKFGTTTAASVNVVSGTSITATSPTSAAGPVAVSVTNPDGQSGTLSNAFTYFVPASAISFIRVAYATPQSAVTTVSVSYSGTQTAGGLNIVVVGWNDTVANVLSVQDSAGNVYSRAIGPTTGTGVRQSIYYAANIVGGANTVTVTFDRAANHPDIRILEYRGVTTLDVAAGASGRSATPSSGSVTTIAPNELIFGANMVSSITKSAGTGFTSRVITSPDSDIAEDRIVNSTGTYSATANTSTGNWVMQIVTFK